MKGINDCKQAEVVLPSLRRPPYKHLATLEIQTFIIFTYKDLGVRNSIPPWRMIYFGSLLHESL